jgi:hypothetical protein
MKSNPGLVNTENPGPPPDLGSHSLAAPVPESSSFELPRGMTAADFRRIVQSMRQSAFDSTYMASVSSISIALMDRLHRAPTEEELWTLVSLSMDGVLGHTSTEDLESAHASREGHQFFLLRARQYRRDV